MENNFGTVAKKDPHTKFYKITGTLRYSKEDRQT